MIDLDLVRKKFAGLETFNDWRAARTEEQIAFNDTPWQVNMNSPEQLLKQVAYLALHRDQLSTRQVLMQEIASQDDSFLPLAYRLGALAAFNATQKTPDTKYATGGFTTKNSDWFNKNRSEHQVRPNPNPLERTIQIGDELVRITKQLNTRFKHSAVPVVMVWNHHYYPPRLNHDEVVLGKVTKPQESFVMQEPKLSEKEGKKVVDYHIPSRINGVQKITVIWEDPYVQPEDKYTNPGLPILRRLGVLREEGAGSNDPNALYIGSIDTTSRISKAIADSANYALALSRRSHRPAHRRLH